MKALERGPRERPVVPSLASVLLSESSLLFESFELLKALRFIFLTELVSRIRFPLVVDSGNLCSHFEMFRSYIVRLRNVPRFKVEQDFREIPLIIIILSTVHPAYTGTLTQLVEIDF